MTTLIHRDSKPWQVQVWVSFLIAVFLCAVGLTYLPGQDLDRAFMVMGYFFCLSAAFVLAMSLTGRGLWRMEVNDTYKTFLGVSWLYLITCTFTLAKTLRDRHEADLNKARIAGRTGMSS